MFKRPDIISAIEIGTSKICVLIGSCSEDEPLTVIGRGEVPLDGDVVKGEIADMDKVLEKLTEALEQADASSGNELNNSLLTTLTVSACNINSYQASAPVFIKSAEGAVDYSHIEEAVNAIEQKPLPNNQEKLNIMDSYYLLDSVRRVRNPIDQNAHKFELFCHVIYGDSNRLNNFRSIYQDAGFETAPELVFSALADLYGIVSPEERDKGALLLDLGRGTTEYLAVFNDGVFASGVVPVGFDHVANDLSIGLNLPIEFCRNILMDGTLQQPGVTAAGLVNIQIGSTLRRIPLISFEKIIDLRLRELFNIVKSNFYDPNLLRNLACGGIITGGGALFPRSAELFQSIFEFPVRIGHPYDLEQQLGELANPRYSTIWGALRYTEEQLRMMNSGRKRSVTGLISDAFGSIGDSAWRTFINLKSSIKI